MAARLRHTILFMYLQEESTRCSRTR